MIYICSLFSNGANTDSDLHKEVRQERVDYVMQRCADWMKEGKFVYSPILHSYGMSNKYDMPKDYEFWKATDRNMVERSDAVYILKMEDDLGSWEESVGMQDEIDYAASLGIPLIFVDCEDYFA